MEPEAKKARLGSSVKAPKLVKVASCNLNQWAMDFKGNLQRIKESIKEAKAQGCSFRTGPELEITGYTCEDWFLENDTFLHAWSSMADILRSDVTDGILCDIGMPVMHRNVPYNCRVWAVNRKIVGIRPKIYLANDGNYREMRWFTPWYIDPSKQGFGELEEYFLPREIGEITGQAKVPFGIFAVSTKDTCLATETCEELFTPDAPHIKLALDGVEIIANGSGSHHQLRKLDKRIDLVRGATSKSGGVYIYANVKGGDGGRLYFDGCSMVWCNGKLLAQGSQFGMLDEIEVVVATVNLNDVRSMRSNFIARSYQASSTPTVARVEVDFCCCHPAPLTISESQPIQPKIEGPMEEIAYGPSAWLWDYLRRSGQRGYFLPLSGGADSSSTAALVGIMCQRVFKELTEGTERSKAATLADIRKVTKRPFYTPPSWQDFCGKIFVTCYMASEHSGSETRSRAENLAKQLGANHTSIAIRPITDAIVKVFQQCHFEGTKIEKSKVKSDCVWNASGTEDIALQNIQARSRMVMAYFMAQLMPWATDQAMQGDAGPGWGSLLVLGSANVDEALRGYYTKYDCSAADVNPIGGINKRDLKAFLIWAAKERGIGELERVANAVPTAELRPDKVEGGKKVEEQSDEKDMGMSYDELGDLGHLRKVEKCGPLSTFLKLRQLWSHKTAEWTGPQDNDKAITPSIRVKVQPKTFDEKVAQKVKDFFFYNAINRHKMTTLTPSYHAENYSPDDNRFDLRPFLFPAAFDAQFEAIDEVGKCSTPSHAKAPERVAESFCNDDRAPSASGFQFAAPYRPVVMCGSMQMPLPCQQRQPAGAGAWRGGSTLWAEIDRRYPVTPLVHDIVEEALREAPEAFQAPELRRDLKPRLRAVILEALSGGARPLMLQNPNDRVILGVVLHNAEAWRHFARAARRQSAQSGLSRELSERFLEAVRLFLGLEHQPEESPEKFWDLQPDRPLHPIDDLAPLLCSRSTWQQEELPPRRGLIQEPVTMSEALRNGYCGTSPSSTLDFAWLLPAGQSPGSAEFKERTVEALLQLPGVHARACELDAAAGASRVAYPASHRSPKPRQRAGQYDHIQARIDTNLPESAKSSPRSSRSPSRQRSSSPRVTKLVLPTGSNPGSPRSSSRGSGLSPRRATSNGAKSQQSEMEEQLSKELSTSSRPRSARSNRSNRSQRSQSGQFRQPAPRRN